jgi:CheY-like chemotaxis protein
MDRINEKMQTPRMSQAERSVAVRPLGRVLIVEDEELLAQTFVKVVARAGGQGTAVGTARAALEQLRDHAAWSAVVLDEVLPDGSGIEVLSWLRARNQSTPALVFTGLGPSLDLPNRAFALRARFLHKPASLELLKQFLQEAAEIGHAVTFAAEVVSEEVPRDLSDLARAVREAADLRGKAHAEYAYRMALLARAVSSHAHRGLGLTESCARAVNVSRSELQRFTTLTTRWTPAEIRSLLTLRDSHGRTVTVHHLLSIATAPRPLRSRLEQAVRDGTEVRQVTLLLRSSGRRGSKRR